MFLLLIAVGLKTLNNVYFDSSLRDDSNGWFHFFEKRQLPNMFELQLRMFFSLKKYQKFEQPIRILTQIE
jgi:hypothetical protein